MPLAREIEEYPVGHTQDQEKNPTDAAWVTKLATFAFGPGGPMLPSSVRDELIARLMPVLWWMAWRLARPDHDLAEELRADALLKCEEGRYDPVRGEFAAWVGVVMKRNLITILQSRGRATGGEDSHPERADMRREVAGDDTLTAPLPADDVERIRKWNPRKRAILLAQSLLWKKVPAELWAETLEVVGLPPTFPGPDFADMSIAERNLYLAKILGVKRNTIHVQVNRWFPQVLELQFVRELADRTRDAGENNR